jgi:hypothetical protein
METETNESNVAYISGVYLAEEISVSLTGLWFIPH